MIQVIKSKTFSTGEFLFQLILHAVVFSFYALDNEHPRAGFHFETFRIAFFINYALANAIISYILLPRFFYRKKYGDFITLTLLTIGGVIFIEESLLEKVFFPVSRGASFPGILFSLGQVLPIIFILSGFKFAWDALTKQREVEKLTAMIQESELQFLKSQINPHFLFNNLNNLYAYAVENSPKTPTIILELSSVLRYMLYDCKEKYVSLTKEVEHLENFTQLYELQIEERGEINFNKRNIRSEYYIAPLILIVFIENAFKHSQASQTSDISIEINIELSERGILDFRCKNNFLPTSNSLASSGGIGLENVKKRLQLLYPDAHELSIIQSENQYEVALEIQLQKT